MGRPGERDEHIDVEKMWRGGTHPSLSRISRTISVVRVRACGTSNTGKPPIPCPIGVLPVRPRRARVDRAAPSDDRRPALTTSLPGARRRRRPGLSACHEDSGHRRIAASPHRRISNSLRRPRGTARQAERDSRMTGFDDYRLLPRPGPAWPENQIAVGLAEQDDAWGTGA